MINKLRVYIGRFQPFHNGHMHVIKHMIEDCEPNDAILILTGSADNVITFKNPFSTAMRHEMIASVLDNYIRSLNLTNPPKIIFRGVHDVMYSAYLPMYHNDALNADDNVWKNLVLTTVDNIYPFIKQTPLQKDNIILYGSAKENDSSTYYLNLFQNEFALKLIEPYRVYYHDQEVELSSTKIREFYYQSEPSLVVTLEDLKVDVLPIEIQRYLKDWTKTESFKLLREEYDHYTKEKAKIDAIKSIYPYSIKTIASDVIVVNDDKILLIERKDCPGRGLLALPGGHVNDGEDFKTAALRELKEETSLDLEHYAMSDVPISLEQVMVADNPGRSLRPIRVISVVYSVNITNSRLAKTIKAGDDAARYQWIPINSITDYRTKLFEDHFYILNCFINMRELKVNSNEFFTTAYI